MMKYYRKIKTKYCDRRAMMAKARANTELCKGCRLCVNNCPRKAIIPLEKVNKKGYEIARRTIAKYRERLGFPVARLRKEL